MLRDANWLVGAAAARRLVQPPGRYLPAARSRHGREASRCRQCSDCHTHILWRSEVYPFFGGARLYAGGRAAPGNGGAAQGAATSRRGDRPAQRLRNGQTRPRSTA